MIVFGALAFAGVDDRIENTDFILELLKSMGGFKGASMMAAAVLVTQLLMKAFQTKLADKAGKWRLLAVTFFSLASGILALKLSGIDWMAAVMHSTTLAALQVFVNQFKKQFIDKANE